MLWFVMRGKSGAMEMSVGTIVVIVLSMSMLILGMVLISNIFEGAQGNTNEINDKVRSQIGKLFTEGKKTVVNLPNQIAKIKQNEEWGVSFGVSNLQRATDASGNDFSYVVTVADASNCGGIDVSSWIKIGGQGNMNIAPGGDFYGIIRFLIPEGTPLCIARFHLEVKQGSSNYATDFFDVEVLA
jgi:hypothetical protein